MLNLDQDLCQIVTSMLPDSRNVLMKVVLFVGYELDIEANTANSKISSTHDSP